MRVEEKVALYDVPAGLVVPLGEVCKTTSGGTPSRKNPDYFSGPIPWVKSGELPDGPVVEIEESISEEALRQSSAKLFPAGTLLMALYGATVGKLGILTRPAATNQAVCAIFPPPDLDTKFLFWFLRYKRSELIAQAVGGAQPNISQGIVRDLEIPRLPHDQQKRIVTEIEKQFSRLDEAVANLKRVKANLKRYKTAVLKAAVEGKFTEAWRKQHPDTESASELHQHILAERRAKWEQTEFAKIQAKGKFTKDDAWKNKYPEPAAPDTTGLPGLPAGWVWATLEQLTTQIADVDHKMPKAFDGGIPYVSTKDFNGENDIDFAGAKRISPVDYDALCKKVRPVHGDILLSRYGTVGVVRIVKTDMPFQASYSVAILKLVNSIETIEFLTTVLRSDVIQSQIKRDVRGAAQPDLGLAHIRQFVVPFPSLTEQKRIIAEVERHLTLTVVAESQVNANLLRAERMRQSVLSSMFSSKQFHG